MNSTNSMASDDREFFLRVAEALAGCQLVEQELKLYISEALELVSKCVGSRLPFRMSGADYEGDSLGKLIKVFEKLSDNQKLVADLRDFVKHRNELSHTGIVRCLNPDGELDRNDIRKFEFQLAHIERVSGDLCDRVNQEANSFRGHLWFEHFDQ